MQSPTRIYSLPRWRVTRWLADCGPDVPHDIRVALIGNIFGGLPVFAGGVINTVAVAAAIAIRTPTAPFISWLVFEVSVCVVRLIVLLRARHAALRHRRTPTDIYLLLAIAWSASVGYGVIVSLASHDWVAAVLAGVSAAAMVGGICFRNFSAPRLAAVMILISLGSFIPGAILDGEKLHYIALLQVPLYLGAMTAAAFSLNKMLIATMRAERENDYRAKHDALTALYNRTGFFDAVEKKLAERMPDGDPSALLFLDLDSFKAVNDTYGHAIGDQLLKLVADRLKGVLSESDVVGRIGGDEFVVLAEIPTHVQAMAIGQRLIAAVASTYHLGGDIFATVGASVGIAMAPEHAADCLSLMAVADAALYEAKSGGKSRWCMGSANIDVAALRRLQARMARAGRAAA
jgi:diguanylate cyclase